MSRIKAALLLLVLVIGLTGCGGESQDAQETAASAGETPVEDPAADNEATVPAGTKPQAEEEAVYSDSDKTANDKSAAKVQADKETPAEDPASGKTSLPAYKVTPLEESTVMYASTSLNVRQGPSTDYEVVGSLSRGEDITITGQADTGWYEIVYHDEKDFVSNEYVLSEKPEDPVPEAAPETQPGTCDTAQVQPVTEVKNVAGVIMVGDSRFVQMQNSVGENPCTWIAESSKGYKWLNETAVARIDNCVGQGTKILINLGVNDPGNLSKYLELVNAKAEEWVGKGAKVYYSSVNPVWENPYVTEEQVKYFNTQMQSGLSANITWIDSHSYLDSIGYRLVDGLHYSSETYQNLYAYYMSCL